MSWIKKKGHPTPNPTGPGVPPPSVPMFNPNQHYPENQWQQPQQQQQQLQMHGGNWYDYNQQQQNYNQHYQNYQQQNYGNLQYNQQYNAQNNAYNPLQPVTTATTEGDAWNWGWGDEDNSNIQANEQVEHQQQPHPQQQQQNFNESFSNDTSWNWSLDDPNNAKQQQQPVEQQQQNTDMISLNDDTIIENRKSTPVDQSNTKRNKLDTPQWSVESQISQESSDDVLQTSESDKSYMLSQSSTISHSPVGQELAIAEKEAVENKEIINNKFETIPVSSSLSQTPPILPPTVSQSHSSDDNKVNPYKLPQSTGSHKSTNKPINIQKFPSSIPSNFNQLVNLETLPDNSEQPDTILSNNNATIRKISVSNNLQWLENNEAPINDRNQYLETGQLSDVDTNNYTQNSNENNNNNNNNNGNIGGNNNNNNNNNNGQDDTLPPPGLRRMVLGQIEQNENEPLPNFSRMVPGQLENSPNQIGNTPQLDNLRQPFTPIEPPEGLRRMVPGESSSPESISRQQQLLQQQQQQIDHQEEDVDSEIELTEQQQHQHEERSATIGADTPTVPTSITSPTSNATTTMVTTATTTTKGDRSETIGADLAVPTQKDQHSNNKKTKKTLRRDSIEGQIEEKELINSIKNLTVSDDSNNENNKKTKSRHSNRQQDSSDSEQENNTKTSRDRRRYDERYSPDYYHHHHHQRRDRDRDRKYDKRRYKERHYDDDNTDYSDKERRRYNKDDYDRKYDSLRKEKERRHHHQRRDERYRDTTKRNDYYRYDDNYENESRSRASSRSDSIHDSTYRDRDHDTSYRDRGQDRREHRHRREKERQRRHHDTYNPYQAFGYDIYSQYYQQYQYYENLRKTDPQAYAQLYRKYYQDAASRETPSYGVEGRASVHSGRSSANDELVKDRYTRQSFYSQTSLQHGGYYRDNHSIAGQYGLDNSSYARTFDQTDQSLNYDDQQIQRMTPMKFTTAHIKASISSGKLIKILPNYPLDGQSAIVELYNLDYLLSNDEDYQELKHFPGPLIKGVTHKKTIIEYCERKIKDAYNVEMIDPNSYILMWELLILLIRQNGMVVGTDIAELLLKDRVILPKTSSIVSSIGSNLDEINNQPELASLSSINNNNIREEEITNKFREYLLYGSCKEALEWAMKHGLWGHALFLASKLDKRTYANVLMRFANGLTMNDPLQTLYQLLSGKVPAAVTCVADEKWGDWRPHLAMILSNSTQRPELNCKSITILGDTLLNRGNLYAAQFCYLMAEVGFGRYNNPDTKLVLLGANHHGQQSFRSFATNEAIHMTEIYEYACSLNDDQFTLHEFQRYKYLLSTRLADVGLLEKSLQYLERISKFIETNPNTTDINLVNDVIKLADRLKFYDPVNVDYIDDDNGDYGANLDISRPDNSWLKNLKDIQLTLQNSRDNNLNEQTYDQSLWQQQQEQQLQYESYQQQQQQWTEPQTETSPLLESTQQQQEGYSLNQYQDQSQYWQQQQQQQQQWSNQANNFPQETVEESQQPQQNYYGSLAQNEQSDDVDKPPTEDIQQQQQPQILLPNQHKSTAYNDESRQHETTTTTPTKGAIGATKPKSDENSIEKSSGNGWFGGIFSKLTLKPKNQMKLPDDKNPSIVWDPEKKRWVNTEEDNGDGGNEFKPPPKMSEIQPKVSQQPQLVQTTSAIPQQQPVIENSNSGKPPMPQQSNMFKLQRGRNLKKSYIDVFNPNAKSGTQQLAPPGSMPIQTNPTMNFFIPQPVNDPNAPTDFLTPSQPLQYDENSQQQQLN